MSGVRKADIDGRRWIWTVRRQTTPGPGGLIDKATKGKRAWKVPIIEEARELVAARLDVVREALSPVRPCLRLRALTLLPGLGAGLLRRRACRGRRSPARRRGGCLIFR